MTVASKLTLEYHNTLNDLAKKQAVELQCIPVQSGRIKEHFRLVENKNKKARIEAKDGNQTKALLGEEMQKQKTVSRPLIGEQKPNGWAVALPQVSK